jgi:macrolide-specific efflux system membrane fusion protein
MTTQRTRWLLNGALAVALAAALGVGALVMLRPTASAASSTPIRTVAVSTGSVQSVVTADGTVQAVSQVAANFETSGTVATLLVEVGDTVTKGQTVATLDRTGARRQLTLATANLASAEASLTAAEDGTTTTDPQTGTSTTTVNDTQVLQAESQVLQAQASVDDAETALAATVLRAPIAGTVLEVNGRVGSTAGATTSGATGGAATSTDVVVVADLTKLEVAVSFSEADVADLAVGQAATVTFPALADVRAAGTITSIDPTGSASNSVVTFGAVVRLSTVPAKLRLGQSAAVSITTGSASDVVVVPSAAVTTSGSRTTVTTVAADGSQRVTRIEVGVVGAALTEVTSGVVVGDQVLLTTSTTSSTTGFPAFPGGGLGGGLPVGGPPAGVRPGG